MKKEISKYVTKDRVKKTIILCSILLVAGLLIKLGKSLGSTDEVNPAYLNNQVVDGISFENASLEVSGGESTFIVEVYNDGAEEYSLNSITVTFKDSSEAEIISLLGYIGEMIGSNEKKYLEARVDSEISEVSSIVYTINK